MMRPDKEIEIIRDYFEGYGCKTFVTGSYALGYHSDESDIDIFVLATDIDKAQKVISNYDNEVSWITKGGSLCDPPKDVYTESYYSHGGNFNIIMCWNAEVASRWETATKLAKAFQLESKPHRIACFQMCKAGVPSF